MNKILVLTKLGNLYEQNGRLSFIGVGDRFKWFDDCGSSNFRFWFRQRDGLGDHNLTFTASLTSRVQSDDFVLPLVTHSCVLDL